MSKERHDAPRPGDWLKASRARTCASATGKAACSLGSPPEHTSAQAVLGDVAKKALDHAQPRRRGGREVHVEARMRGQPLRHNAMLVRGVVVHYEAKWSMTASAELGFDALGVKVMVGEQTHGRDFRGGAVGSGFCRAELHGLSAKLGCSPSKMCADSY